MLGEPLRCAAAPVAGSSVCQLVFVPEASSPRLHGAVRQAQRTAKGHAGKVRRDIVGYAGMPPNEKTQPLNPATEVIDSTPREPGKEDTQVGLHGAQEG